MPGVTLTPLTQNTGKLATFFKKHFPKLIKEIDAHRISRAYAQVAKTSNTISGTQALRNLSIFL